ncbi:hypothetical protein [Novosphingobium aquae]|jgi:hypothetical protein|uniref:Lipoprotein n=1 Tax=Novosphingobium aquae TaxID=3133435 RepID=A0ABU8S6B7_9SPHN
MKKIMLLVAIAAVSACSKPEPAAEAEATPVAVASAEANIAADGKSSVGKYKITLANGDVVMEEVKADGTYADMVDGKVIETGKWVQKSPSQYCYTKDKPEAVEECNAEKVENGVWTSTNPKGETSKVERVEG